MAMRESLLQTRPRAVGTGSPAGDLTDADDRLGREPGCWHAGLGCHTVMQLAKSVQVIALIGTPAIAKPRRAGVLAYLRCHASVRPRRWLHRNAPVGGYAARGGGRAMKPACLIMAPIP